MLICDVDKDFTQVTTFSWLVAAKIKHEEGDECDDDKRLSLKDTTEQIISYKDTFAIIDAKITITFAKYGKRMYVDETKFWDKNLRSPFYYRKQLFYIKY